MIHYIKCFSKIKKDSASNITIDYIFEPLSTKLMNPVLQKCSDEIQIEPCAIVYLGSQVDVSWYAFQ